MNCARADGDLKMENNISSLIKLLSQFPLKNKSLEPNDKIIESFDIFNSLLLQRLISLLEQTYENVSFDFINNSTTINEIYNEIKVQGNDHLRLDREANEATNNKTKYIKNKADLVLDSHICISNFIGIGTDIENHNSLPKNLLLPEQNIFRRRIFSSFEITYSLFKPDPRMTLLGIFSAKESIIKSFSRIRTLDFREIDILHDGNGKPYVKVDSEKDYIFIISISHSDKFATSNCICFKID